MAEHVYALRILAWGDPSASASEKSFRLATRTIQDDPDDLYIGGCLLDYPKEIAFGVSLSQRVVEGGEQTFTLGGSRTTLAAIGPTLRRYYYEPVARLTEDLEPTDTTVKITASSMDGDLVYIGLEAIVLGTEGASGTYSGCTRAALGTLARRHTVVGDPEIHTIMHVLVGRRCEFIRCPLRGGYSDEQVLWSGVISEREADALEIVLKARVYTELLTNRRVCESGRWRGKIHSGVWWSGQAEGRGSGTGADPHLPIAGPAGEDPECLLCIDGKFAVKATWTETGPDRATVDWNTQGDHPALANLDNQDETEEIPPGLPCWEFWSTDRNIQSKIADRAASVGQYLSQNPIRFIQQILTTTPAGNNGVWDLGVGFLGLGLHAEILDQTVWDAFAVRFSDVRLGTLDLSFDGEPVEFDDLLMRVFGPIHISFAPTSGGLGLATWRDAIPYEGGVTITHADHIGERDNPGKARYQDTGAMDSVKVLAGKYLGAKPDDANANDMAKKTRYPHQGRESLEVDASGYDQPASFASLVSLRLSEAYRTPPPVLPVRIDASIDPWPDDVVDYTHPFAVAPDGTVGLENIAAMVISRKLNTGEHGIHETLDLELALTGLGISRAGAIAPAMRIKTWTPLGGVNYEAVVYSHWFKEAGSDPFDHDAYGFEGASFCYIVAYDLARKGADYEACQISSITYDTGAGEDTIALKISGTVAPVQGDIIRLRSEGLAESAIRDTFAFLAPSSGTFASGRAAYQYVLDITPRGGGASSYTDWERIDSDAVTDEWPFDEALLEKLATNVQAICEQRLSASAVMLDVDNPQLLHGYPHRLGWALAWYLPRDVTELTINLLVEGNTEDTTVWASLWMPHGHFGHWSEQVVGSSDSGVITFVLDGLDSLEGLIFPVIVAESTLDTPNVVIGSSGSNEGLGAKGTQVQFASAVGLSAGDVYAVEHDDSSGIYPDPENVPGAALLLAESNEISKYQYYVWPPWGTWDSYGSSPGFVPVNFTPMGYVEIYSAEIEETDSSFLAPPQGNYRSPLETAARTIRRLQEHLEWASRNRTTVLGAGPAVAREAQIGKSPYVSPPSGTLIHGQEISAICVWASPLGRYAETQTTAGTSTYQQTLVVEGLLGAVGHVFDPEEIRLEVTLLLDDTDGTGTEYESDPVTVTIPFLQPVFEYNQRQSAPWLRLFSAYLSVANYRKYGNHPARGLYPAASSLGWADLGFVPFRVVMTDSGYLSSSSRIARVHVTREEGQSVSKAPIIVCPGAVAYMQRVPLV